MPIRRILPWAILALLAVIAFMLYRSRSGGNLDVSPDAHRAIEKAKQR